MISATECLFFYLCLFTRASCKFGARVVLKALPGVYPQFRLVLSPPFEYKYRTQSAQSRQPVAVDSVLC